MQFVSLLLPVTLQYSDCFFLFVGCCGGVVVGWLIDLGWWYFVLFFLLSSLVALLYKKKDCADLGPGLLQKHLHDLVIPLNNY